MSKESKLAKMYESTKEQLKKAKGKAGELAKSGHVPGPIGTAVTVSSAGLAGAIDGLTGSESMTAAWVMASTGMVAGAAAHMAGAPTLGNVALDSAAGPASALAYRYANMGTSSLRLKAMAKAA